MSFDIHWVRAQFPALHMRVNGRLPIFFDAPGGTQVPQQVVNALTGYLTYSNANTGGAFFHSVSTDTLIAAARQAMADFLGCAADEVVFGANMTSLAFMLSRSIGQTLQVGDEILVTALDHDANVAPWQTLSERGAMVQMVALNPTDCTLDMADFAAKLSPRTKLVAVGYASNAVGTINDLATIIRQAHAVGALVFVDAVHYAPHGLLAVHELGCDFLACSPYKFFGPHGGVLYGRRELLQSLPAYKVRPATNHSPERWETGTQNHEALAGMVAAIDYLAALGQHMAPGNNTTGQHTRRNALIQAMQAIRSYECGLSEQLISGLLAIPSLTLYGIAELERLAQRTPTVALRMAGHTPRQLAQALGERGIYTWDGNFYALNLTECLAVEQDGGLLRIGLAHYHTSEEIIVLLAALHELAYR